MILKKMVRYNRRDACVARSVLFPRIVASGANGRRKRPLPASAQPPPLLDTRDYFLQVHRVAMLTFHALVEFLSSDCRIKIRLPGEGGGINGVEVSGDDNAFADEGL